LKQVSITSEHLKKIKSAKLEFYRWRSDPHRKLRIPDKLWRIAINLANDIGITKTRKILSLDYVTLRKKVLAAKSAHRPVAQFVKLDLQMARSFDCQFEIQSASQKVIFEMKGVEVDTLVQLIRKLENK
jgi:hypothetical protein